ncbi:MAG: hypothetical protein J6X93_03335 [Bacilli bacterium]|nr:hypothetical protein [Bacilli bacterium]
MKNILILFLSFFLLTTIQTTNKDKFLSEVKNGYKNYEVLTDIDDDNYTLCVVRGVNKNKASLGIYFHSVCDGEYVCIINDGSSEKELSLDKNKEAYYPAMSYTINLAVNIYNCDDELVQSVKVNRITVASFAGEAGNNAGINFSGPGRIVSQGFVLVYIVGIGIIVICAIIIILLKVNKKGMFNDDTRKEGLEELHHLEQTYVNTEFSEEDEYSIPKEDYQEDISHEQVYERTRDYDDEIDENRPSVKSVLNSRGFNTDYLNMSVEDKNKVMVELMMMREQGIINNDEYQHEIVDLWKK